jgi:hypothetical protein
MIVVAKGVRKSPAAFPHAIGPGYRKSGLVAALSSAPRIGIVSRPKPVALREGQLVQMKTLELRIKLLVLLDNQSAVAVSRGFSCLVGRSREPWARH